MPGFIATDVTASAAAKELYELAKDTSSADVTQKLKWLKITVMNMDQNCNIAMEKEYFPVGRSRSQPFEAIGPNQSAVFYVCNGDIIAIGVSGGIGFGVVNTKTRKEEKKMFVCTFSNPMIGMVKGHCRMADTIPEVWNEMWGCDVIREDNYGFYKKDDTSLVFIWKSKGHDWY